MRALQVGLTLAAVTLVSCGAFARQTLTHQMTGVSTSLESVKGRVVVINFWADWCGPCIDELPALMTLVSEAGPEVSFFAAYYEREPFSRQFRGWFEQQPEWFRKRV